MIMRDLVRIEAQGSGLTALERANKPRQARKQAFMPHQKYTAIYMCKHLAPVHNRTSVSITEWPSHCA